MKYTPNEINYTPRSMSFAAGFLGPMGDVGYRMVADRGLMREIFNYCKSDKGNIQRVECGLLGDWNETIFMEMEDDELVEVEYGHDNSIWAKPAIIIWYNDRPNEMYECWKRVEK